MAKQIFPKIKKKKRFKTLYKKIMRFKQCIVQVGMTLSENFFEKCAVLRLRFNILLFLIVVT